ncbi:ankyrin repeat-containing domain protein [Biscogniauxia marginata]|nr:ankyrin repeat-containing domain protein [Biscogniauxia marginata]
MEVIASVASFLAIGQALVAVPKLVSIINSIRKANRELSDLAAELERIHAFYENVKANIDLFSNASSNPPPLTTSEPQYLRILRTDLSSILEETTKVVDDAVKGNGHRKALPLTWLTNRKIRDLLKRCHVFRRQLESLYGLFVDQASQKHGMLLLKIYAQTTQTALLLTAGSSTSPNQGSESHYQPTNNLLPAALGSVNDVEGLVQSSPASSGHQDHGGNSLDNLLTRVPIAAPRSRCGCSCHSHWKSYQGYSQRVSFIGRVFISYCRQTTSSSHTSCEECLCGATRSSTVLRIRLPLWLCSSAILGTFSSGPSIGISMSLRPIVMITRGHDIWQCIKDNDIYRYKRTISASPFGLTDSCDAGFTLIEYMVVTKAFAVVQFCPTQWLHSLRGTDAGRKSAWEARIQLNSNINQLQDDEVYWFTRIVQVGDEDDNDAGAFELFSMAKLNRSDDLDLILSEKPELVRVTNPQGDTLLHAACESNAVDTANLLLHHGAQIDARNLFQYTPLHHSIMRGANECARVLLDRGADVNAVDARGCSPLLVAAGYSRREGNDVLMSLLSAGACIRAMDNVNRTILHHLVINETAILDTDHWRETLKVVLDAGGDRLLEARDKRGTTPLLVAVTNRNHNAVRVLLDAGARTDVNIRGSNLLHLVAQWGTAEVMEVLREAEISDIDIRTTNQHLYTPLRWFRCQLKRDPDYASLRRKRPGEQETKAFEELLRDVRDRVILIEVKKLEGIISKLEIREFALAKEELVQLTEAKLKAKIRWEAETFRAIELDVRANRIELAVESLWEFIEESRKRLQVSPFDEEEDEEDEDVEDEDDGDGVNDDRDRETCSMGEE